MSCYGEISWLQALGAGVHEVRTSLSLSRRCSHEAALEAGRLSPLSRFGKLVSNRLAFRTNLITWEAAAISKWFAYTSAHILSCGSWNLTKILQRSDPNADLSKLLPAAMFRSSAAEPVRKEGLVVSGAVPLSPNFPLIPSKTTGIAAKSLATRLQKPVALLPPAQGCDVDWANTLVVRVSGSGVCQIRAWRLSDFGSGS